MAFSIAVGFVFYGVAAYKKISTLKHKTQDHLKRLFVVTLIGGLSFLTHAIILVVQAADKAVFLASIIFLMLSELAPEALFLCIHKLLHLHWRFH
jgi:hypothetical protein